MLKIKNIELESNVILAPMAGVTDKAFRLITKPFGPALMYTEMVSGKGLFFNNKRTGDLLDADEAELPIAVQLFGHEPQVLAEIAYKALEHNAQIIDINMGCPAPKIVKNGDGSALMRDPELVGEIVSAVSRATSAPVTVKIRKGWDDRSVNAAEVAKIAESGGAAAITVHGRTREQFYSGCADLDVIKAVKDAVSIPVIGNGDVTDGKSAARMIEVTGCDGVMIGRAAEGNPWIFAEVLSVLRGEEPPKPPTSEERAAVMRRHLDLLVRFKGEHRGILEARKHISWYMKGIAGGAKLRVMINTASSKEDMLDIIKIADGQGM